MRILLTILLILLNPYAVASSNWQLSPQGLGPIKIGMSLKEVQSVTHEKLENTKPDKYQAEDESCFYSTFVNKNLSGISLMIAYNKVARIDITSSDYTTTKGIRIGDTEAKIEKAYPDIKVTKHRYDQNGQYLTSPAILKDNGIRFETSEGKVTLMYAGRAQEIQYVEACV